MSIKPEYTMKRDDKVVVLYAGLLDAAHEKGLLSIETVLVQIPSAENANIAICTATVRLADKDGVTRTFMGVGDASPGNVNRMMAPHIIRMAETRAKARALRDAINVSEALADDPADDADADPKAPPAASSSARSSSASAERGGPARPNDPLATDQQRGAIEELSKQLATKSGKVVKRPDYETLTQGQANQLIDRLEQWLQAPAAAPAAR